jgi:hypothetical protein
VTLQKQENSESGWLVVLLDSIVEQATGEQPLIDAEIMDQLEKEWAPYLEMPTEMIQ